MAGFVQIIEIQTSRIDDVEAIGQQVQRRLDDGGSSSPRRGLFTEDRDRPGYYLNIVEFESYEAAMENSSRPEVSEFAEPARQALRRTAEVLQPRRAGDMDTIRRVNGGLAARSPLTLRSARSAHPTALPRPPFSSSIRLAMARRRCARRFRLCLAYQAPARADTNSPCASVMNLEVRCRPRRPTRYISCRIGGASGAAVHRQLRVWHPRPVCRQAASRMEAMGERRFLS